MKWVVAALARLIEASIVSALWALEKSLAMANDHAKCAECGSEWFRLADIDEPDCEGMFKFDLSGKVAEQIGVPYCVFCGEIFEPDSESEDESRPNLRLIVNQ